MIKILQLFKDGSTKQKPTAKCLSDQINQCFSVFPNHSHKCANPRNDNKTQHTQKEMKSLVVTLLISKFFKAFVIFFSSSLFLLFGIYQITDHHLVIPPVWIMYITVLTIVLFKLFQITVREAMIFVKTYESKNWAHWPKEHSKKRVGSDHYWMIASKKTKPEDKKTHLYTVCFFCVLSSQSLASGWHNRNLRPTKKSAEIIKWNKYPIICNKHLLVRFYGQEDDIGHSHHHQIGGTVSMLSKPTANWNENRTKKK